MPQIPYNPSLKKNKSTFYRNQKTHSKTPTSLEPIRATFSPPPYTRYHQHPKTLPQRKKPTKNPHIETTLTSNQPNNPTQTPLDFIRALQSHFLPLTLPNTPPNP